MVTDPGNELAVASLVYSCTAKCYHPVEGDTQDRLEVVVMFTDAPGTLAALRMALGLAQQLEAHIRVVMPYEVPYALPLERPAVSVKFLEAQIRGLTSQAPLEVAGEIYLCRDKRHILKLLLRPHSLLVVGGKKRWWRSSTQEFAQNLRKDGHHVIFAELR